MCSTSLVAKHVIFVVNDTELTFDENVEPDLRYRLQNENEYAVSYIQELINSNFITLDNELQTISREEETGSTILFPSNEEHRQELEVVADVHASKESVELEASQGSEWSHEESRFMLDKYEKYLALIGPLKKFKNKKRMWEQIAADISKQFRNNKSAVQVENRYKTIMKRKKKAVDMNKKTGEVRKEIEYEAELNKIAGIDDSTEPEVLRGVTIVTRKVTESTPKKAKAKPSLNELLSSINEKKEEAKERRHKEKMNLLQQLIDAIKNKNV